MESPRTKALISYLLRDYSPPSFPIYKDHSLFALHPTQACPPYVFDLETIHKHIRTGHQQEIQTIIIHCPFHVTPFIDGDVQALKNPIQMMERHAETVAQLLLESTLCYEGG